MWFDVDNPGATSLEPSHVSNLVRDMIDKVTNRSATVAVIGQGYVGLVLAMRASEMGFPVIGYEIDPARYQSLRNGISYIDDVSDEQLQLALARGYKPASEPEQLEGFDVAVITVPTPLHNSIPDLTYVEDAAAQLGVYLKPGCLVILESTTYPGTTEEIVGGQLEQASGGLQPGKDFFLGYSPERIDPGNSRNTLESTPKLVSGIDSNSLKLAEAFYSPLVAKVIPMATLAEAELAKLIENTFRHVNIALVNELAMFANDLGVDIWAAIDGASTKPFGFMPFRPGPGVGGHCLPVDPSYLSWRVKKNLGKTFHFIELANEINTAMPEYVVRRVQANLNKRSLSVKDATILVLGFAYKPGTRDARETPSLPIVRSLIGLGAQIKIVDPHVQEGEYQEIRTKILPVDDLKAADLVLLLTDHPEFDYDLILNEATHIFDTRGRLRSMPSSAQIEHL